jgi:hypothetical protein
MVPPPADPFGTAVSMRLAEMGSDADRPTAKTMHRWTTVVTCSVNAVDNGPDGLLDLFLRATEASRQNGVEYLKRYAAHTEGFHAAACAAPGAPAPAFWRVATMMAAAMSQNGRST